MAQGLEITPFDRDRVLFDVGAAFGRNEAQVRVSGSAPPGIALALRIVNARTGAAGPWHMVPGADAEGRWQISLSVAAQPDWHRLELRAGEQRVRSETRFGTGDVVAVMGQSELARLWKRIGTQGAVALPDGTVPDQVQFTVRQRPDEISHMFADDRQASDAMRALATFWQANAPAGRRLHIVDLTQSGTARVHLQNDADPKRNWSDFAAMVARVEGEAGPIGLVLESWFAGDRGVGLKWPERFMPLYTGTHLSGRDFVRGSKDSKGVPVDHFLWDLSPGQEGIFEVGETALGVFGPHRFDSADPLAGPMLRPDGKVAFGLRAIDRARRGIADFLDDPRLEQIHVAAALPRPLDYANGFIHEESGTLRDITHPSKVLTDGAPRLAKHVANAALFALGHQRRALPELDQMAWQQDYVELASSAGPITTARQVRGLPPLGTAHAHWTDVLGFEINGVAAERAELTQTGRIRIYPQPGRKFVPGDVVSFGRGGAGGLMRPVADWKAAAYLNYPIVDFGLTGLEGVAVLPGVSFTLGRT